MYSSQLTDYKRLQTTICSLQQQLLNSGTYTNTNDIIPNGDDQYTIGNSNNRFHSLHIGSGTIYMGDPAEISANYSNIIFMNPGVGTPFVTYTDSTVSDAARAIKQGIQVYYNVACNDLWKIYSDGTTGPFGTERGTTGPEGPIWQFSNDLIPLNPGLNIGSSDSNVNNLFLSNVYLNNILVTIANGALLLGDIPIATQTDITNGVSSISSIVSYGLSSVVGINATGLSSLSSIVSYGLSSVVGINGPGTSSLSSIVSYGLSSVAVTPGLSSLSSIVSYGLSSVSALNAPGISSLSSIVSYGLSTVAGINAPGISSLSSIVSYGLSSVAKQPGTSSLSSIVSYGLSSVAGINAPGISSLSSIVSYGLSSVAALNAPGISSLSSIVSYGLSSVVGINGPGTSSLSSIVSYGLSTVAITNAQPLLGGVLRVDSIYGDDTAAPTNKYQISFKTIAGAMAATVPNDFIQVLPGTYNEQIVFSNYVSVRGVSLASVNIQQLNVTSDTTLVTMGTNTRLEDITLNLTSSNSNAKQLVGVLWSNVELAAKLRSCVLNVNNSAMTCNVATNVYGIYATGSTATAISSADAVQRTTVNVTSSGPGLKRAVFANGSNFFAMRDTNLYCIDNPLYATTSGGSYIGAEINNANGVLQIKTSTCFGATSVPGNSNADISQTSGQFIIGGSDLPHKTANGYTFTSTIPQPDVTLGISGTPTAGFTYGSGENAVTVPPFGCNSFLIPGSINNAGYWNGAVGINSAILNYTPLFFPTNSLIDVFTFTCTAYASNHQYVAYLYKNNVIQSNFTLYLSNSYYTRSSNVSLTMLTTDNYAVQLSNLDTTIANPLVTVSIY